MEARVAIELGPSPAKSTFSKETLTPAVEAGGGVVVETADANAIVWLSLGNTDQLECILDANPAIKWVQLPWAGVESYFGSTLFERKIDLTSARGAYGAETGEHAFMLLLTAFRNAVLQAREKSWHNVGSRMVRGSNVTVLGAGDVAQNTIRHLSAAGANITVLRKTDTSIEGFRTLQIEKLHEVLPETDALILALPLTPHTVGIVGKRELAMLPRGAVLINVARGQHVDTDALIEALASGHLGAAGLDVTDPEPLPDGHPLWSFDNVLITSHSANAPDFSRDALSMRITDNVQRFVAGEPLQGKVDPAAGY